MHSISEIISHTLKVIYMVQSTTVCIHQKLTKNKHDQLPKLKGNFTTKKKGYRKNHPQ